MKPRKFRIVIEYDGTDFAGWQFQPQERTVQDEIEKAIEQISGNRSRVTGSGRTDAGVHARGQVAHFSTTARLGPDEWVGALNANLPKDVRVLDAARADPGFDARRSAGGKWYRYEVFTGRVAPAIDRNRVWHLPMDIDVEAMRKAARYFRGEHDFRSFRGSGCASKNTVRVIRRLKIKRVDADRVIFDIEATAFLKHMVRNIVGTLVEVGRGRIAPKEVKDIINARDRRRAGPTAPAQGLTLMTVYYDRNDKEKTESRRK